MKKIILLFFLLFPFLINAESCDYSKLEEYNALASNINYDVKYNQNTKMFDIYFYNVYQKIYFSYNSRIYHDNNNEIVIKNINEGEYINIKVYAPVENCNSFVRTINIVTQYYNPYYNDQRCDDYKNILSICKSEFLTYKPTNELLNSAINNYNNSYEEKREEKEVETKEITLLTSIKEFAMNWGIQLILGLLTSILTIIFFKNKFRKIKHGI